MGCDRVLGAGSGKERNRRPARRAHEGDRGDGRSAAALPGQVVSDQGLGRRNERLLPLLQALRGALRPARRAQPGETGGAGCMAPRPRDRAQLRSRSAVARHHCVAFRTGWPMAFTQYCARTTHATRSRLRREGSSRRRVSGRFMPPRKRSGCWRRKATRRKSGPLSCG